MNCPKCGAVIPSGSLYCETCGEDIHIVPDFEPEIEYSIKETLNNLVEDIAEDGYHEDKPEELDASIRLKQIKRSKGMLIIATFVITVAVMSAIAVGIYYYRYNSLEYQLGKAAQCISNQRYEDAIGYYERALLLDGENVSAKFLLADVYYIVDRKEDAVNLLAEIALTGEVTETVTADDLVKAYTKMIHIYREEENYEAIRKMLDNCNNQEIFAMFQEYSAREPGFSYEEGSYDSVIPLKLTTTTAGTIYYTLDGSVPTEKSEVYTTPIFLETGDYTVSAVFVNTYGIASEVATKSYHVEVLRPGAPEITVESGEYNYPTLIEVEVLEGYEVYYTTDGTNPNENSIRYTGPIPMPLGASSFRFITYDENDLQSDITVRNFYLDLYTEISPEAAVYKIMEAMVVRGKIYDFNGNSSETEGKYQYLFQYAVSIEDAGDFYVITEVIEDSTGTRDRTGSNYAVNIYTGDCYKLYIEEYGKYRLESF